MKLLMVVLAAAALAPEQDTRFVVVDLYADTGGRPLVAWQIELECNAKIVGVEGSGAKPPFYDPAALQGGKIILASFTTDPNPPAGRVLVARVHLQETGKTDYTAKLMAAASPGGARIEPRIDVVRQGGK